MKHVLWAGVAAGAALLAACGHVSNPAPAGPTPGPTCSPPSGTAAYSLVYPAPNSTAIPDNFGQIVIATSPSPLPATWNVVVTTAVSPAGVGGTTLATATPPFPQPTAAPSFSNPNYQRSNFSGTFQGEVVHVYLNNTASNCTPLGPLGQFTTQ